MGDLNVRIGSEVIDEIKNKYNEGHINENGETLIDFCISNNMRIIWQNIRGQSSIIDYVIWNRVLHPSQVLDVRSLTSAEIGSDHRLVLCKLRLEIQHKKKQSPSIKQKLNIESVQDEIIKNLYEKRLT